MRILYGYLRQYKKLIAFALLLAAINQIFSLLDPLIFRHVIDQYATKYNQYTKSQFFSAPLLASRSCHVSRRTSRTTW